MRSPVHLEIPAPMPELPEGQEPLAGLEAMPLVAGTRLVIDRSSSDGTLVLASACDKREDGTMRLRSEGGTWEVELDFSYCSHAQRFHLDIPAGVRELIVDSVDSPDPLWVVADDSRLPDASPQVWSTTQESKRPALFFDRLEKGCVAQFGWMGGCVLEAFDGMAHVADRARWSNARDQWLAHFLSSEHLRYQDPRGRSITDEFRSIETGLPIAAISRDRPDHPILDVAVDYLSTRPLGDVTCEGCYTLAYPLMQVATLRGDDELAATAVSALNDRYEKLFHDGHIYLRYRGSERLYQDWSRGVAWYLLGWAECILLAGVPQFSEQNLDHLHERAEWVMSRQLESGMWPNFFDQPDLPGDTSGSSGIAAALVLLSRLGIVSTSDAVGAAQRCWHAVQRHLLSDGWLSGVAPSNKRGEAEQRRSLRAAEAFGMGLMGRLASVLGINQSGY